MVQDSLEQLQVFDTIPHLVHHHRTERALNFIVGLVMKKTRGKASPGEVHDLVKAQVEKV